ncbi:protein-disulfide reductase DsbD [Azohydromonas sp. G-1-1-14]|uniref:Thiol:disulfide interchange protein DsbD n=2 Tax=Azohydromonas caseinilytica TaxID=2728836 RepID=A0A848FIT0_9BURK|nr:protein-disulfide reductase DsbD [Azohydromonas caseinilytica]
MALSWPAQGAQEFLAAEQAFELQAVGLDAGQARLQWRIAPGYYLYRERFAVSALPSGQPLQPTLPPGERKDDPNFGVMEVYHGSVAMQLDAAGAEGLRVTWQGCAEAGLCYPPQTRTVQLAATAAAFVPPGTAAPELEPAQASSTWSLDSDGDIARLLRERSLAWTLPLFFALGLALAFTPCVLPMLPLVSSLVVGRQAAPRRALGLSLAFVLPMAATYAAMGVAAALAGANLQALLQNRWTALALGALYGVLALGMFGAFTLQLPAALRERLGAASRRQHGGAPASAAALGVLSALLVGPCMTAPLAGALLYIAQDGRVAQGALVLFSLGLGMGLPLVLASTLGARVLPRPGPWMEWVKGALGFALLGSAVWMLERAVSAPLALLLWGALLLGVAAALLHRSPAQPAAPAPRAVLARTAALVAGLWGGAMVLGAAAGASDPWRPLPLGVASAHPAAELRFEPVASVEELHARVAAARAEGRATMVDFYADWCVSCKAIEREVFADARVQQALAGMVLLRADVTANDARHQALMHTLQVAGPPTVLFFDAQGRERRSARLVGEFDTAQLLQRQATVGQRSPVVQEQPA